MAHSVTVATLPSGTQYIYLPNKVNAVAGQTVVLTDEEFAQLAPDIFTAGYLTDNGLVGVVGTAAGTLTGVQLGLSANKATALATGTLTAGSLSYAQPFTGASYKKFLVALTGTSSTGYTITFPTAFTVAPNVTTSTGLTGSPSASTTTLTVGAQTTQTGWIIVEGW